MGLSCLDIKKSECKMTRRSTRSACFYHCQELPPCCHSACKISPREKAKCFPPQGYGIGSKAGIRFGTGLSPPCPQTHKHTEYLMLRKRLVSLCRELLKAVDSLSYLSPGPKICNVQVSLSHTQKCMA